jgi:hypothetical protein
MNSLVVSSWAAIVVQVAVSIYWQIILYLKSFCSIASIKYEKYPSAYRSAKIHP